MLRLKTSHGAGVQGSHPLKSAKDGAPSVVVMQGRKALATRQLMKPVCLLLLLGFSMFPSCLDVSAQEPQKSNSTKDHLCTAQAIAERTLEAMRNSDVSFLSNLADPTGLYIGIDVSKMTVSQFRKELSEKRGVYCVILDSSCIKNSGDKSDTQYSLREVLIRQPVTVTIGGVQGAPDMRAAAVKNAKRPNETLFTLMFRRMDHNWKLQQIEYE